MTRSSTLVAAFVAVITGFVALLPAGAAVADGLTPTTLALSGPATGRITGTVQLIATLTSTPPDAPAEALAGQTVTVQRWDGSAWASVSDASTGDDGTVSVPVTLRSASNQFRAVYAGDATHAASTSGTATIAGTKYPTRLAISGDTAVVDEHYAHLTLTWRTDTAKPVPGTVRVYSHVRNTRWQLLRIVPLGADGRATIAVRPRVNTWYLARGWAGAWWQAPASATRFIDNRPPMRPIVLPSAAPRPDYLAPQARAVGAGANITVSRIPTRIWNQMTGITWHRGCPVGRAGLRLVRTNYWGFDGYRHRGELVVNRHATGQFRGAFRDLYAGQFPIRAMYRVDRFGYSRRSGGGNDFAAMRHDDTSAFNCRWVTGNPGVRSPHSYGYALDLNTWENPYRSKVGLLPDSWWMGHSNPRYAWRSRSHAVVRIMLRHGFRWTYGLGDTQHFDA